MIWNLTLIIGISDKTILIENNGSSLKSLSHWPVFTLFNIFYLLEYVSAYRFVKLNVDTSSPMQEYQQGAYDFNTGIFPLRIAIDLGKYPNISLTPVINQYRCVPFHSARRPTLINGDISHSVGVISVQGYLGIFIALFIILLVFFICPKNDFKVQLRYLLTKAVNVLFGITFFQVRTLKNSTLAVIGSMAAICFVAFIITLFLAEFTTNIMSFKKDRELKTPEELENWKMKGYVEVNTPCTLINGYRALAKRLSDRKQILTGNPLKLITSQEPGMVVSTVNPYTWYYHEVAYYNLFKDYAKNNYLVRGDFYASEIISRIYNNKRVSNEKLKLYKLWVRGLLEMNLHDAAMYRTVLEIYKITLAPQDRFKSLFQDAGVHAISLQFFRPAFYFLIICMIFCCIIFLVELSVFWFKYKNRSPK